MCCWLEHLLVALLFCVAGWPAGRELPFRAMLALTSLTQEEVKHKQRDPAESSLPKELQI